MATAPKLYLGRGNIVVCEAHINLVELERFEPQWKDTLEDYGLPAGCMICATPPEPGRRCENEDCRAPLHERWPGLYCSYECAWRDAL